MRLLKLILYMIAVMYFDRESNREKKYSEYKQWCINKGQLYREKIKRISGINSKK